MSGTLPKPEKSRDNPQRSQRNAKNESRDSRDKRETRDALPFLKEDRYTNVVLIVEGKKLFINSCVLGCASPYFDKLFNDGSDSGSAGDRKSLKSEYRIEDKSYDDFEELLSHLHPAVRKDVNDKTALRLLPLAHEYEMDRLKERCQRALNAALKRSESAKEKEIPRGGRVRRSEEKAPDILLKCLIAADKGKAKPLIETCCRMYCDPNLSIKELKECDDVSDGIKTDIYEKRIDITSNKLSKVSTELDREKRENESLKKKMAERATIRAKLDRTRGSTDRLAKDESKGQRNSDRERRAERRDRSRPR